MSYEITENFRNFHDEVEILLYIKIIFCVKMTKYAKKTTKYTIFPHR